MPVRVSRLQMITPFDSTIADLPRNEQALLLKGCALCRITRQVDEGSTRNKSEWKECKTEFGVDVDVFTRDVAPRELVEALGGSSPPAVFAVAGGRVHLILDGDALERCRGSVGDFRGRLIFRLAQLDLELPGRFSSRPPSGTPAPR